MNAYRAESDSIGSLSIPAEALYGVHTARAIENFPLSGSPIRRVLVHAYGFVKHACLQTAHDLGYGIKTPFYEAIVTACQEMQQGELDAYVVVDALQGGAGTSTNMNINEVLANRALQIAGFSPGDYNHIHPIHDVNLFQSTNDTYPTALRIAALRELKKLATAFVSLQNAFESKEAAFADVIKVGRTQLQDAVLTTMGRSMSAYAEAFSRDRWRIFKCDERLRVINLGGTAIGTGTGAPRDYIFRVSETLRSLTGLHLARAENMLDSTQNADVFVEVSGILKAGATSLIKCASDIRLLASGPDAGFGELELPALQAGSSIMPGKVNPVIPEAVIQASLRVIANDQSITSAASMGNLELNAFLPLIADNLLDSIDLLNKAASLFVTKCLDDMKVKRERCNINTRTSIATATMLAGVIGYQAASDVLKEARETGASMESIVCKLGLLSQEDYQKLMHPDTINRLGSGTPSVSSTAGERKEWP